MKMENSGSKEVEIPEEFLIGMEECLTGSVDDFDLIFKNDDEAEGKEEVCEKCGKAFPQTSTGYKNVDDELAKITTCADCLIEKIKEV